MSPRKSSTSSGKPRARRPRYLGVEVAGEHLPSAFSPRWWEEALVSLLESNLTQGMRPRLVKVEGRRAIVAVDQVTAPLARSAWNGPLRREPGRRLLTRRTWGTLVGAKAWLRRSSVRTEARSP